MKVDENLFPKVILRESANDGSDFSNPAADHRVLFLGEDGLLHLRDSAGTVTTPGGATDLDAIVAASSGQDVADALAGAAAPDAGNVFATMADVGGGVGGGGGTVLPLDVPPGSAHAKDDEFNGASLDGKWTDPATSTRTNAVTFSEGWMLLEPAASGSGSISTTGAYGIRQAAPAGSFTISCKLVYDHLGTDIRAGLFTGRLTATAKGHMLGVQDSTGTSSDAVGISGYSHTADWGTYDGFVDATTGGLGDRVVSWFKMVWDSTTSTFSFFYSKNGVFWTPQITRASQQQPEYIGLGMWSNTSAFRADNRVAFDWFRVTEP